MVDMASNIRENLRSKYAIYVEQLPDLSVANKQACSDISEQLNYRNPGKAEKLGNRPIVDVEWNQVYFIGCQIRLRLGATRCIQT